MSVLDELTDDYERADALVHLLIDRATGASPLETDFVELRRYFVDHTDWSDLLPRWFPSKRSLNQFWGYIKYKFPTYAERRAYLWEEFDPLLSRLETGAVTPAEEDIEHGLKAFSSEEVNRSWRRMIRRIADDPDGAITASRNLLETVLKHILDERSISYDHVRIELPDLYKKVQSELGLAPRANANFG